MASFQRRINKLKRDLINKWALIKDQLKAYQLELQDLLVTLSQSSILKYTSVLLLTFIICLNLSYLQDRYLSSIVTPNIVKITLLGNPYGGGTGFFLQTPKGVKLLTNAHICEALSNGTGWAFIDGEKEPRMVSVERISEKTDLCVMSGSYAQHGLTLGSRVEPGDHVTVFGHPSLDPTTISKGYIVSNMITPLQVEKPINQCQGYGYQVVKQQMMFFENTVCVRLFNSYLMTNQIYPGNSGSPVLNFWGNVVGIVFASDTVSWKGRMIGLEEIEEFLSEK